MIYFYKSNCLFSKLYYIFSNVLKYFVVLLDGDDINNNNCYNNKVNKNVSFNIKVNVLSILINTLPF